MAEPASTGNTGLCLVIRIKWNMIETFRKHFIIGWWVLCVHARVSMCFHATGAKPPQLASSLS